jgi:NAD(P)-dependent dehydrogenase (short-subunit alcohol dehydrogenase family)
MSELRFDGRVAVITGAGRGLGRQYALDLAARGARVVVNDLGGTVAGEGASADPARTVAAEIAARGGTALANREDVATPEGAARLVASAREAFGRVDALVCNAGILRDRTLANLAPADFEAVVRVHLLGTAWAARAVLPVMREQQYGRIVVTTSHSGLFGNFGQTSYASAKMGLVGFMLALKEEGARHGILVNAVAPLAVTRLGAGVFPPTLERELVAERVSPVVVWLASEACQVSGEIVLAGAGRVARAALVQSRGIGTVGQVLTPEQVADQWDRLADLTGASPHSSAAAAFLDWLGAPAFGRPSSR